MSISRVILIVLDSVGIGELPDADNFNDVGSHTLLHISQHQNGLRLPNMQEMGLGNIEELVGVKPVNNPTAFYGKMVEISRGKDTTTGHWEMMGLETSTPFPSYPNGFPIELIQALEERVGRKVIGNCVASGTQIIEELGAEHMETGNIIVYTSADSVFQIAAHEEVVPLKELYHICEVARELTLEDRWSVVRVIARPFVGQPGKFIRTANRKDYSVKPPHKTVLNYLQDAGIEVVAVGKISDIFDGEGISKSVHTESNMDGVDKLLTCCDETKEGLIFINLVDFDAKFGHRRDPVGYGKALEDFDARLPEIIGKLTEQDLLIITADHGNDPTFHGTDHTREYTPILVYNPNQTAEGESLGIRKTFADVGATIADIFQVESPLGESFYQKIKG
ncbi:phosphopentomutase [Shimazuella sp. AN120528]|uniref:phosphopentomutase n=1 Tax=Shimazuella soli TaxID=1892854 RepID=UPI001F0D03AC|nr:phosphopentomutase [Shimazuella soli]